MLWWLLFILGWFFSIAWLLGAYKAIEFYRNYQLPKLAASLSPLSEWPLVSIIVPARNEESKIGACLSSLLNLDYPSFEIIAVDDRSDDSTGKIMDRLAKNEKNLKVIHIKRLPERWLGKNHAMHQAARIARGEFVLFTDGDVFFEKNSLKTAMRYAVHRQLDHMTLFVGMITGTYWENAMTIFFGLIIVIGARPKEINSDSKKAYMGLGAFNLVRRSAYDKIGGHERLRMEVIDDLKLGKLIKRAGFSQALLISGELIKVRWQYGVQGMIKGLEKNGFAIAEYSIGKLIVMTAVMLFFMLVPYVGSLSLLDARIYGYALAVIIMHGLFGFFGLIAKCGWRLSLAFPFAGILNIWALWRSAIITLRQGGIRWRDTFYPLELLRSREDKA